MNIFIVNWSVDYSFHWSVGGLVYKMSESVSRSPRRGPQMWCFVQNPKLSITEEQERICRLSRQLVNHLITGDKWIINRGFEAFKLTLYTRKKKQDVWVSGIIEYSVSKRNEYNRELKCFFGRWYECIQYIHPLQRPEWVQILLRRHKSRHMHTVCVCVCVRSIWKLLNFYWMCLRVSHNCADLRLWSGLLVSIGSGNAVHFTNIPTQKSVCLARIPLASLVLTSVQLQRREVTKYEHSVTVIELIFAWMGCKFVDYLYLATLHAAFPTPQDRFQSISAYNGRKR